MISEQKGENFTQNVRDLTGMDELDQAFTSQYAAAKEAIREAQRTVQGYNRNIEDIKAGKPTAFQYTLQGPKQMTTQHPDDAIARINHQKEELIITTLKNVDEQIKGAEPVSQEKMHQATYQALTQQGRADVANDKTLAAAPDVTPEQQRFIDHIAKAPQYPEPRPEAERQSDGPPAEKAAALLSFSIRATASLSHSQAATAALTISNQSLEQSKAPDEISQDNQRPRSFADRLSQSLSYTLVEHNPTILEEPNSPTPSFEP